MLKLICAIFFLVGGAFFGITRFKQYKDRIRQLELCELMLIRVKAYVLSEHTRTDVIIDKLCKAESLSELSFIKSADERLKTEVDFPLVWKECVKNSKNELALCNDDYEPVIRLAELLGTFDTEGIAAGLDVSIETLRQLQKEAIRTSETEGKLKKSLYMLSGAALAILII